MRAVIVAVLLLGAVIVAPAQGRRQGHGKPTPPPNTTKIGERKLLAILVNFQDKQTQPYSAADVESMLFSAPNSVNAFIQENSQGITWVTGNVTGWHTLAANVADCSASVIQQGAEAAARAAGYDPLNYQHVYYVFDFASECAVAGLTGGGSSTIGDTGAGYSYAWIHLSELVFRILAHEFGHGLGLVHSRPLDCGAAVLCGSTPWDSGDSIDMMGGSDFMHYNGFYKEYLGWQNQTTVTADGAYTILPVVSTQVGPRALKILKSTDATTGKRTFYYVEWHQNVGFEDGASVPSFGFLTYTNYFNGLAVHLGTEGDIASSFLLDLTPNSNATQAYLDIADGALLLGHTFTDPNAGVSITAQALSPSGATVWVDVPTTKGKPH